MKPYMINKFRAVISYMFFIVFLCSILFFSKWLFFVVLGLYFIFEVGGHFLFNYLRSRFQWLITGKDKRPEFSKALLDKFFLDGFDVDLGWSRKPNTTKNEQGKEEITTYHINKLGQRLNPNYDEKPILISTFGDSFTFGRQVNDHETYQSYLSKLSDSNVLNYGVGNYGLDQALLRLKKEYSKNKTKVVILGAVPSTIVRVLCVWKHYNEFGNILAFKPRFYVENNKLILKENIINSREKFINYAHYLTEIKEHDDFYHSKFLDEILCFPYLYSILKNPIRHGSILWSVIKEYRNEKFDSSLSKIMEYNLILRKRLFKEDSALKLMNCLIDNYIDFAKNNSFIPLFLWMPQKDDMLSINSGDHYYKDFINGIKDKIEVIDLTNQFSAEPDLNKLYCDDSQYGGHLSKEGNKIAAKMIYQILCDKNYLERNCLLSNIV